MTTELPLEDSIVAALRRIMRAVDLHSRQLHAQCGLTGPQLATLQELERRGPTTATVLARAVHLSTATMAGILNRLEREGLVVRRPSEADRRSVTVEIARAARDVLAGAPSLLQDSFRRQLGALADWERHQLYAGLQRIAGMMDAQHLDAAPHLTTQASLSEAPPGGAGEGPGQKPAART